MWFPVTCLSLLKIQQKTFHQTVFCQMLAPDRLWHMVACLLSHWGFLTQLRQMVAVIMAVNASQMTVFFLLKRVNILTGMSSRRQRTMCCRTSWKRGWRMPERRLISSKGLEPRGDEARAPIRARHVLALGPSSGSTLDLSEP